MLTPHVVSRSRVKTHVPMLQVWTAEKPHPQEEVRAVTLHMVVVII